MVFSDLGIHAPETGPDVNEAVKLFESGTTFTDAVESFERHVLLKALERNHWKKGSTADELGLNMRTMQRKLKKYGL